MATPSYDLSGLASLENTIAKMVADQAASPTRFAGGANFTATFGTAGSSSMTTAALQQRLIALRSQFDLLTL
jgi:hypothetical protein